MFSSSMLVSKCGLAFVAARNEGAASVAGVGGSDDIGALGTGARISLNDAAMAAASSGSSSASLTGAAATGAGAGGTKPLFFESCNDNSKALLKSASSSSSSLRRPGTLVCICDVDAGLRWLIEFVPFCFLSNSFIWHPSHTRTSSFIP